MTHRFIQPLARPLANGLWYLLCLPESTAFHLAKQNIAETQRKLLLNLLHRNAQTEFGRRYGFADIRSIAEYQARLPLSTYEDYRIAIEQVGAGRPGVLTCDPVLLLEPTSGSTAATKHIPYTASLKTEFQRAIAPWMVNLFNHHPQLLLGQAYWSITPITRSNERTPGGIPIGFEKDSEYFGGLQRHLIQAVMAVPSLVRFIDDMDTFRYVTLLFLLRSRSLTLISVWNPTFLILLVEGLSKWWFQLVTDIAQGTISTPNPIAPDLLATFKSANRPDGRRAAEVRRIFQTCTTTGSIHAQLWPQLRLISCWTDAQAAPYASRLAALFPQAQLQGKGLLATEGVVTFPLVGHRGAVLAIRSHFFEFLPVGNGSIGAEPPLLAHQLELGRHYEVILTTGGGLYRYQLHDLVEVVDWFGDCPLLRFGGKAAHISDWFGEKLNEHHVQQALLALLNRHRLQPNFAMLACEEISGAHAYLLFIEINEEPQEELWPQLSVELDTALQENFHYKYCRELGQLGPVRVFRIEQGALESYLAVCQAYGQRAGDIKPVTLHHRGGWLRAFEGKLIDLM
jgi:hypothetical protein